MKIIDQIHFRLLGVATILLALAVSTFLLIGRNDEEQLRLVMEHSTGDVRVLADGVSNRIQSQLSLYSHFTSRLASMSNSAELPDSAWGRENLAVDPRSLGCDLIWVFRNDGKCIYSTGSGHADISANLGILRYLSTSRPLTRHDHYLCATDSIILELHTAPIESSPSRGLASEPIGYVVAALVWDEDRLAELSALTGSQIAIQRHAPLGDLSQVKGDSAPLQGYDDVPTAFLRVDANSGLREQLIEVRRRQEWCLALSWVVAIGVLFWLTVRWVSKPLRSIAEALRMKQLDPIKRVVGLRTEFGEFARLVEQSFQQHESFLRQSQSLSESEEKFRSIFEYSAEAAFLMSDVFLDCNENACRLFRCTRDEIIGWPPEAFSPEYQQDGTRSQEAARRYIQAALEGDSQQFRWQHLAKGGTIVECEVVLNAINISGRTLLHAAVRDVSERVKLEQDRMKLVTAIEQTGEAIVVTDVSGVIEFVNPAFENLTGYRSDEVVGRSTSLLKSGSQDAGFYEDMWSNLLAGNAWRGQLVNRRKDGSTYREEMVISPIWSNEGRISHFVGFKRDISRQVELEQMLAQSQKMEALGRLAGGVAHDFNNLLTIIIGHSEFLRALVDGNAGCDDHIQQVLRASDRAAALTRQLLQFSRKQVAQMRAINLSELVSAMARMFRRVLGENIEFNLTIEEEVLWVHADPSQLEQIVMNLVINARDAMENSGRLNISLSAQEIVADSTINRARVSAGRYAVIRVEDTGCGMSEELTQKIFEPFFTTKSPGKGTGLGLATVHGIVQNYNGVIDVISRVGEGTTFHVYLPLTTHIESSEVDIQYRPGIRGRSDRIMLVEDDDTLRRLVERILESLNYEVDSFNCAEVALTAFSKSPGRYALLLTDLILPHVDGRKLAELIRETDDQIAILLMSGYANSLISDEVLESMRAEFITKPFTKCELGEKINSLLYQRDRFLLSKISQDS